MAQKGGKMATFAGTCYVTIYDATPLLQCGCVNCRRKERGPSHGTSSVADSCLRNSSGVILRNSQKLNAGNFRPSRPYGV